MKSKAKLVLEAIVVGAAAIIVAQEPLQSPTPRMPAKVPTVAPATTPTPGAPRRTPPGEGDLTPRPDTTKTSPSRPLTPGPSDLERVTPASTPGIFAR